MSSLMVPPPTPLDPGYLKSVFSKCKATKQPTPSKTPTCIFHRHLPALLHVSTQCIGRDYAAARQSSSTPINASVSAAVPPCQPQSSSSRIMGSPTSSFEVPFVNGLMTPLVMCAGWLRLGYWLNMIDSARKGSSLKCLSCVCSARRKSCALSGSRFPDSSCSTGRRPAAFLCSIPRSSSSSSLRSCRLNFEVWMQPSPFDREWLHS